VDKQQNITAIKCKSTTMHQLCNNVLQIFYKCFQIPTLKIHFCNEVICMFKGKLSDSFTNYNYVGNTKVSVSIKKT